ncbi:MAG: biopolymer transporter ExbD [Lentisphaeria bacterium]|jgi:biopolymer transport protein ExbD|nr:biopolymer transporter ExbD [Lentisphaeria bacterium]
MPRSRSRKSGLRTVNDINVTPLMDLTFLLLIVFMITAPTLEYVTNVSPPSMSTPQPIPEEVEPLMVNLAEDGTIWFHKEPILLADLISRLRIEQQLRPDVKVLIRGDEACQYGEVIEIMKAVKKANITSISLVTQPEP